MSHRMTISRGFCFAILVVFTMVLFTACGRDHLYYDARELRHEAMRGDQKAALAQTLADKLKGRNVSRIDDEGQRHRIEVTPKGLATLTLPELGALWLVVAVDDNGGENDIRVKTNKGSVPVQVTTTLAGDIELQSGGRDAEADAGEPLSEQDIRTRFGLKHDLPGKWKAAERAALVRSLELLDDDELAVVRPLTFVRAGASSRDPQQAALYALNGCKGTISLYATGVASDRFRFIGDAKTPRSAVLHSLLHEIGHAIAAHEARTAYCAADRTSGERKNSLVRRGNDVIDGGAVLAAYLAVLGDDPAPTDYGRTSPQESFAESFALFHVDPTALKRVRPRVYAWFARGGHHQAQRDEQHD